MRKLITIIGSMALLLSLAGPTVAGKPPADAPKAGSDFIPSPLSSKQAAAKAKAQELVLKGKAKATGENKVVKVGNGQFVELAFEGEDNILTLLGEFGTGQDNTHEGRRGHAPHGGTDGPSSNEITEPDRSVDNTTIWQPDFSREYYEKLLYSKTTYPSMANYFLEQSSGKYSVNGYVSDWVQVPNNAATYGSNYCGDNVCQDTWFFIEDQGQAWYQSLVDSGMSDSDIEDLLADYDVWDRYDYDGDGNFDEPDGYIDHFQSVHAGQGEEVGGGDQGSDAIWSHRWYVQLTGIGAGGPEVGGEVVPFGGVRLGNSSKWIGDYTVEPENGGVGVFAHEFAHDLNLPDEYERTGGENSTGWWTLMSQGSYGTQTNDLGTAPTHMSAWDKIQLGFIDNYRVDSYEHNHAIKLGPAEYNTKETQALVVLLPDKEVAVDLGDPYEGTNFYYSGSGDNLDNSMTRTVTLPADGDLELNAQVRYEIEEDWDYAYLTVDGVGVETNLSTDTNPNGQNFGEGITGASDDWDALTADLSAFAGQTVEIGFRYWTDGAVVESGFQVDALEIPGEALDGAESNTGWTFDGFAITDGSETGFYFNAYVAEFRQYRGYDKSLQTGPYNFGFLNNPALGDWVEHFPYPEGLLLWYWDTSQTDNDVAAHPGSGLILPIDAHPQINHWSDGTVMRPRLQAFDAAFGLVKIPKLTVNKNSVPTTIPSRAAVSTFDDSLDWWFADDGHGHASGYQPGWNSVDVPNWGMKLRAGASNGSFMWVYLNQ